MKKCPWQFVRLKVFLVDGMGFECAATTDDQ
jgi:hypothetical protein